MRGRKGRAENEKSMKRHIHCWGYFCGHWALVVSAPPEKHTEKNVLEVFTWSMEFRNIYPVGCCFLLPPFHCTISQEMSHWEIFCLGRILLRLASSNKIQSRKRNSKGSIPWTGRSSAVKGASDLGPAS